MLGLDWYCNLHIIEYRPHNPASHLRARRPQTLPNDDPVLYPPSIATKGEAQIRFSIQYLHLREESSNTKTPREANDLKFFSQLDYSASHYINICIIEPGKVLFKPTSENVMYFIDLTKPQTSIYTVKELSQALKTIKLSENLVIYQHHHTLSVLLYGLLNKKTKTLGFKSRELLISLSTLKKRGLCIACFENSIEILHLATNRLLERVIFQDVQSPQAVGFETLDMIVFGYISTKAGSKDISLETYTLYSPKDELCTEKTIPILVKGEPVVIANTSALLFSLELFGTDNLVVFYRWEAVLYRVRREGIMKVTSIKTPFDFGYENTNLTFTPNSWCFTVLDTCHFAVLIADERWGSLQMYLDIFRISFEDEIDSNEGKKTARKKRRQTVGDDVQVQSWRSPNDIRFDFEPKRLMAVKSDYIRFLCCWKEKTIIALTYKHNLLRMDLGKGTTEKIANIAGVIWGTSAVIKIRCIQQDLIAIIFEEISAKSGLIVLDISKMKILFNSFALEGQDALRNMRNIEVLQDVSRIIFKYDVQGDLHRSVKAIGELDYNAPPKQR